MEQTLQEIQGVVCYLDELLITGKAPADHWCSELYKKKTTDTAWFTKTKCSRANEDYQEVAKQYADKKVQSRIFEIGEKVFAENVKGQPSGLQQPLPRR